MIALSVRVLRVFRLSELDATATDNTRAIVDLPFLLINALRIDSGQVVRIGVTGVRTAGLARRAQNRVSRFDLFGKLL